jgi:FdrA protein
MASASKIIPDSYRDSVTLMQLSSRLAKSPGIRQASVVMASANNVALLRDAGLLAIDPAAGPNDLLIAVEGESEAALHLALEQAESELNRPAHGPAAQEALAATRPRSIEMALDAMPEANLVLLSTPGEYACAEALKALALGLNVMLFSDNVTLDDEVMLKRFAQEKGLIVMGPDCGSAIINGVPLGFANIVRRGPIGVVAASGTGLQQVTSMIDRLGSGISQALGTGGRDLHREVGGISMRQGLQALSADPATEIIVLISKPPAPDSAAEILQLAQRSGKPVVVNFLGCAPTALPGANLHTALTLEDAAHAAVDLANGRQPRVMNIGPTSKAPRPAHASDRGYIRGLYSGGTFCYEASLLLGDALEGVYSNTPVGRAALLPDVWHSKQHTLVDMGDDVFTRGRPHPMIDHRLRNERILSEAADARTAIILFDVVLGCGSHPDPAAEMAPVLQQALELRGGSAAKLQFVAFVCGTDADPQNLERQEKTLRKAGALLAETNAQAVRIALRLAQAQQ